MEWTTPSAEFETDTTPYPGLGAEEARPVGELLDVWRSSLLALFYFVPKSLWVSITTETNRYSLQQMNKRAEKMAARQSGRQRETATQIARRLRATQAYGAHEIPHVVGLLVARMLCPQKRCFAAHWTMVEDGATPAGLFGRYMSRDRCNSILRDLHFVDNTVDHGRDKMWKLRPVVDKIQERFLSGWSLPAVVSFDECGAKASKRSTTGARLDNGTVLSSAGSSHSFGEPYAAWATRPWTALVQHHDVRCLPATWKPRLEKNNCAIYRQKEAVDASNLQRKFVLCAKIVTSLEELEYAVNCVTTEDEHAYISRCYLHSFLDSAVLQMQEKASADDPFRFIGNEWLVRGLGL
ncbi:uncharacterized protein IUM83_19308 [Phytophthora cinnamomi]|uniref:uncharacterized protein n=1 Tax=Phytophthora cinnamomi TaxID=4785 RepID=UPI00355A32CE|nr:hypothetical protein IUM83_19308 [Phytophthora cinnamomi]